jgi:hypothetical protein
MSHDQQMNNIISHNSALNGGGIGIISGSRTLIANNIIFENNAQSDGGGIYIINSSEPGFASLTIYGNTAGSKGGGIYHNVLSSCDLVNSIVWDNTAGYYGDQITGGISVTYYNIMGGWSGSGNINADPLFVDPPNGDFHITYNSPCKNTGNNSSVSFQTDFEDDPRIHDGTVDMGADEFHTHLYHIGTVTPGSPIEVKVVGDPGIAPVTLAIGSGIQDPPQPTPYGNLYLLLPTLWRGNLGSIPSNGVLVYPGTVPTSWQAGDEYPFQALVGPLAPGSVLSNLIVLTVE